MTKLDAGLTPSLPASDSDSAAIWGSKRINPRPQSCLCLACSGYPSNDDDEDELPIWLQRRKAGSKSDFLFFFFRRQAALQTWLKRLARKDYISSKYSKLCSLHFKFEDFVANSTDQKGWRKRKRESD